MTIKKSITISDSGFVFNSSTGESFSVNPIGKEIIKLLKQNKSFVEISQLLNNKYNADIDTIRNEVMDFIQILELNSLIDNQDAA